MKNIINNIFPKIDRKLLVDNFINDILHKITENEEEWTIDEQAQIVKSLHLLLTKNVEIKIDVVQKSLEELIDVLTNLK